jgi:peptidoglycan/LPS O-acetylase OafA/YrhL
MKADKMKLFRKTHGDPSLPAAEPSQAQIASVAAGQRIGQLDSLRGVAALTVVIGHFTNIFPQKFAGTNFWWNLVTSTPLSCVMAGHQAVIFFFVLSGFVLSIPFYQRSVPYTPWIIKRCCRIYLPYYGAMLLAMLLVAYCAATPIPSLGEWFNQSFQEPVSGQAVLNHLLLIGSFANWEFNPVVWSLVMEMRISLLFPLLMMLVTRVRWWQSLVAVYVAGNLGFVLLQRVLPWQNDYALTLIYVPEFVVGALLARYRRELVAWYRTVRWPAKAAAIAAAICLYTYPHWFLPQIHRLHLRPLNDFVTTLGVVVFIVFSLASISLSSVLLSRPLVALGKASYSLYLVHTVCLLTAIHLLFGRVPLWGILVIAGLWVAIATGTFYFVLERPSIELGRWFSARLKGTVAAPQAPSAASASTRPLSEPVPPP